MFSQTVLAADPGLDTVTSSFFDDALWISWSFIDRMEKVVTEEGDKKVEEDKIKQALKQCGYPDWTVKKVKQDKANKQNKPKAKKSKETPSTRTSVTIPYIQGVTEKIQRIFRDHQVATAVKPYLSPRK